MVLSDYDVPYFHMKEFAHSTGRFKRWKGREELRKDWHFIQAVTMKGLGSAESYSYRLRISPRMNCFAFRVCRGAHQ